MNISPAEIPAVRASAGIDVRLATPADMVRWEAFVERCPEATFFHRAGWKEVLESVFRHRTFYLLAERDASIVGVLPLAETKSLLFGHALVSLPFCVCAGVAATDPAAVAALHAAARELATRLGVDHLELRNRVLREPEWPRQDLYVTFRKEILPGAEDNLLAIPRKQRAMVRKGIKNGLRSELDGSIDRFFRLYADNMHRHGTPPLPKRYSGSSGATPKCSPCSTQAVRRCRACSASISATRCSPITPAIGWTPASSRRTTSSTGS
jgi:FemAB-related protein (PEP-CTERM system-associated)